MFLCKKSYSYHPLKENAREAIPKKIINKFLNNIVGIYNFNSLPFYVSLWTKTSYREET